MVSVFNQVKTKSSSTVAQAKKRELNGLVVSWLAGSVIVGAFYGVTAKMNGRFDGWALAGFAGAGGLSSLVVSAVMNQPGTTESTRRLLLATEQAKNSTEEMLESNRLLQERMNIQDGVITNSNKNLIVNSELTRQTISEMGQFRYGISRMAQGAAASYGAQQPVSPPITQPPDQPTQPSTVNELRFDQEEYVDAQATQQPLTFNDDYKDWDS
jgi:hypothetical protein